MEEVTRNPGALTLPVKPYASYTIMDMVVPYDDIDSRMELNASKLSASYISLVIDIVDVVILDHGEHTA